MWHSLSRFGRIQGRDAFCGRVHLIRFNSSNSNGVCLVIGAGDATGGAIGKQFAKDGYSVCLVRRHHEALTNLCAEINSQQQGKAYPFGIDARVESEVIGLVEEIETNIGPIEVMVHNIGANVKFNIADTTERVYRKVWEMATLSAFLTAKEVSKRMQERKRGTIIFTGATASLRGGSGFAAFSGAKHAKRALAQSMARELGPQNIHVSHVVVDGAIDTEWIRSNFKEMIDEAGEDSLLKPDDIAANYLHLHKQPKSAWTFELDLRPYKEKW
jgi:NAD(P)-dependent dehydrogenase (short-subunit alcohol dehydrogenase family)